MQPLDDKVYQFGPFRLEVRLRRLYHGDKQIQMRPKTYEILQLLVERAGVLVEKEQMLEAIWPNQIVEETNLTQHIYRLRKILGDSQKSPEYILTIPGKGYLFNQKVQEVLGPLPSDDRSQGSGAETRRVDRDGDDQGERTRRSAGRWQIRPYVAVGLVLLFLTVGGAALALFWRARVARSGLVAPAIVSLVPFPGEESDLAFSPDGRYLVFSAMGETQNNRDIYVSEVATKKKVGQGAIWRVTTHPHKDTQPVWSPDGQRIAFLRSADKFGEPYKLIITSVRGEDEQEVGQVTGGLSWSPDGKYLAVSASPGVGRPTSLYLLSPDGLERKLLTTPPANVYDTLQQFSPDGNRIAFVRWRSTGNADLFVYTLDNRELVQVTRDETQIYDLEWAADSAALYFISRRTGHGRLWSILSTGKGAVEVAKVPQGLKSFSISPAGDQLAFTQPIYDTKIDVFQAVERAGISPSRTCFVNSSRTDDTPRFSPDGSQLAFVSARSGYDEIWIANADCTNARQVTNLMQPFLGSPRWSPDGQWIAFDRNVRDNANIFKIRVDGTDLLQLTSDPAADEIMPAWSRDGEWIYFSSNKTSVPQIYRVPAAGGEIGSVTMSQGLEAIESTDGASLYFLNGNQLWRKDLRRGEESTIPELASVAIGRYWDLLGKTIYFVPQEAGDRLMIQTFNLESRQLGQLFQLPGSLARWVPGISVAQGSNLIAIGYVSDTFGDISLMKGWK